ncbi:NAD(P)-dependent oxidoreductase, partial [Arthrospira platensis SPKY1]|nr:NAD(P)-dependent oxidoreductase [Arthrospira platensis SPKY1]
IYLINTSRGPVVNTQHLIDGLQSGRVLGACLDVLEFEKFSFEDIKLKHAPLAFMELIRRQDVLLSPHIAGWTHESNVRMAELLVSKIKELKLK